MNFKELNLIAPILKAAAQEGYKQPSPVQAEAIPLLLAGRDLLGCAQTGTGKTAAFAMPILQLLYGRRAPGADKHVLRALILTPTRELALQVSQSFQAYGRYTGLKTTAIFGGVGQNPQVEALRRGVDILVATPGRLLDLLGQKLCNLSHVSIFVLDEADRMLDMGFIHDVKRVVANLPKERQTMLFSATMPQEISALAASILHEPAMVAVTPETLTVEAIEQSVYFVDKVNKAKLLLHLLGDNGIFSALVFCRTKHGADKLSRILKKAGVAVGAIHGDKSQSARQNALASFKANKTRVLVATDIAARGIDIDQLSHVINYDLPNEPETYVHRIGRTGRAGFSGVALSFCCVDEQVYLADIQELTGDEIAAIEDHPYPMQVLEPTKPLPEPRALQAGRTAKNNEKPAQRRRRRSRSR